MSQALAENLTAAGFKNITVETVAGQLKLNSVANFWSVFIASSPSMITLFEALGEENTKKVAQVFIERVTENHKNEVVTLRSKACIGMAYV